MSFSSLLINWYRENQRDLPWRKTRDPYRIWLSEIILQQTRIIQGEPYYRHFLEKYPRISDLAEAKEEHVLKLWQGLGYYSRARNLHATAKLIHEKYHDRFPQDYETLKTLPGIGDYTAAAVASFAFGLCHPVVDGNVIRFISRKEGIFEEAGSPCCKKKILEFLKKEMDSRQAGTFNQALMEFGALACTPTRYLCMEDPLQCPFSQDCHACRHGIVEQLPIKKNKEILPWVELHYLFLQDGDSVWVHRRGYDDLWRGMFDLPSLEIPQEEHCLRKKTHTSLPKKEPDLFCQAFAGSVFLKAYVQTLSHRKLHICFYRVDPESSLAGKIRKDSRYRPVNLKDIPSLAVPRNIEKFFREFKII